MAARLVSHGSLARPRTFHLAFIKKFIVHSNKITFPFLFEFIFILMQVMGRCCIV